MSFLKKIGQEIEIRMRYLIDSSAWIDYLRGGKLGEKVSKVLSEDNEVFTISLIIAEVVSKVSREKKNSNLAYEAIISNSKLFELTPKVSKEAGLIHAEMKRKFRNFGLTDALILVSARNLKSKILTSDYHLKDFSETIYFEN